MLLKRKEGMLVLELLIILPLIIAFVFFMISYHFFCIESMCLDEATSETVKTLLSLEIAESSWKELVQKSMGGLDLHDVRGTTKKSTGVPALILAQDASRLLQKENVREAWVQYREGYIQVYCRYESKFLPGLYLTSQAMERSWLP